MRSELDKYGIQMPAFSKIGGILANELSVDEAARESSDIQLLLVFDWGSKARMTVTRRVCFQCTLLWLPLMRPLIEGRLLLPWQPWIIPTQCWGMQRKPWQKITRPRWARPRLESWTSRRGRCETQQTDLHLIVLVASCCRPDQLRSASPVWLFCTLMGNG